MRDALNRQRWVTDQKARAQAAFAAQLPSAVDVHEEKLRGLRELADAMRGLPHMAAMLAAVETQIANLDVGCCKAYERDPAVNLAPSQPTKKPCPICDAWSCSCAKEHEKAHPLEGTAEARSDPVAVEAILRKYGYVK